MEKLKVYIYPNALDHIHPKHGYHNVVPFSIEGLKHIQETQPEEADYFYMGQFNDLNRRYIKETNYAYLKGNENKHIVDIEGDWEDMSVPSWLHNCIMSINGADKSLEHCKICVRPTFSRLLMSMVHWHDEYEFPKEKFFGFMGKAESHGVRAKTLKAIEKTGLPCRWTWNGDWRAIREANDPSCQVYQEFLKETPLCLCPRGEGHDSVRFFEICFYGRVPVVVGDNVLMDKADWVFRISQHIDIEQMSQALTEIYSTNMSELAERGAAAREFFDRVVRRYFQDPTLYLLEWMKNNGL